MAVWFKDFCINEGVFEAQDLQVLVRSLSLGTMFNRMENALHARCKLDVMTKRANADFEHERMCVYVQKLHLLSASVHLICSWRVTHSRSC